MRYEGKDEYLNAFVTEEEAVGFKTKIDDLQAREKKCHEQLRDIFGEDDYYRIMKGRGPL